MKFTSLRKKYPRFIYQKYSYYLKGKELRISFRFKIEPSAVARPRARPDIRFKARINIKNVSAIRLKRIGDRELNNFVFHLGLMEMPSYWKATCSPEIMIRAGFLTKEQIEWWKDLMIKGMGQFFYENKIDWREPDFLKIVPNTSLTAPALTVFSGQLRERYLAPLREGKDSLVTFEKLREQKEKVNAFIVNPTKIAKKVLKTAGIKNPITVERTIDANLLKLNRQGFLNGHTPFTAVLSFLSVFCGALFDYRNIAFSNEKSADEGNINYLGRIINHQYAKTSDFEKKFRKYCVKYLSQNANYFSYLRKYNELQIAKIFSKYPKYFPVFLSCNEAYKTDSGRKKPTNKWCGNCPKCLFSYLILCPYLEKKQLFKIFGGNLLAKKRSLPILKKLIGEDKHKPFECVGTYAESRKALNLCLKKLKTKK